MTFHNKALALQQGLARRFALMQGEGEAGSGSAALEQLVHKLVDDQTAVLQELEVTAQLRFV
jgi:hypothetical protein